MPPGIRFVPAIATWIVLAAALGAAAQTPLNPHDAQPERPSVATHAWTVAPGWIEIEGGLEFDRFQDHVHNETAPLTTKVGLTHRTQLEVQTPVIHAAGLHTGPGDVLVGAKWRVVEEAPIVATFAVFPTVKLPTGSTSEDAGTGTTDLGLVLISSREFGDVSLDVNVGMVHRFGRDELAPHDSSMWSVSFGGSLHGPIGWAAEFYGFPSTAGPAGDRSVLATLLGPTMRVRGWLVMDAGIIVPLTGPQPRALYAGGAYNIGRLVPSRTP